jgi:hypothetical protein
MVLVLAIAATIAGVVIGWLFRYVRGRLRHDVCSTLDCREPLGPSVIECSRCHRRIAGIVRSAEEHFIEAAKVRRRLAQGSKKPSTSAKELEAR